MQIEHSAHVPMKVMLNIMEPGEMVEQSPRHAVPQAPVSGTALRRHFIASGAEPYCRAEPRTIILPPRSEASPPPTAEEYERSPTPELPRRPPDDPLWNAVAREHMAGRVETPAVSEAILPPQNEGSSPPTAQEDERSPTPELPWLPPDDPLWDVVAQDHLAGRVETPSTSAAIGYEEFFLKGKKRKRESEELSMNLDVLDRSDQHDRRFTTGVECPQKVVF
jgi:hypothetical protein